MKIIELKRDDSNIFFWKDGNNFYYGTWLEMIASSEIIRFDFSIYELQRAFYEF